MHYMVYNISKNSVRIILDSFETTLNYLSAVCLLRVLP